MKIIIAFCIISKNGVEDSDTLTQKEKNKIKITFPQFPIQQLVRSYPNNIKTQLVKAIALCQEHKCWLVISNPDIISKDIACLKLLKESNINFHVVDNNAITKRSLNYLIPFLEQQTKQKSEKIKEGLEEIKSISRSLGNPRLKESGAHINASHGRIRKAMKDPLNFKIRQRIQQLKEEEGYSFNQIAKDLNESDLNSRRGKKFYAKTVIRLYNTSRKLVKYFEPIPMYENYLSSSQIRRLQNNKMSDELESNDIINWPADNNFNELIEIKFRKKTETPLHLSLINHKDVAVFEKKYQSGESYISIDIDKQKNLYPGIYYLKLTKIKDTGETVDSFRSLFINKEVLVKHKEEFLVHDEVDSQ